MKNFIIVGFVCVVFGVCSQTFAQSDLDPVTTTEEDEFESWREWIRTLQDEKYMRLGVLVTQTLLSSEQPDGNQHTIGVQSEYAEAYMLPYEFFLQTWIGANPQQIHQARETKTPPIFRMQFELDHWGADDHVGTVREETWSEDNRGYVSNVYPSASLVGPRDCISDYTKGCLIGSVMQSWIGRGSPMVELFEGFLQSTEFRANGQIEENGKVFDIFLRTREGKIEGGERIIFEDIFWVRGNRLVRWEGSQIFPDRAGGGPDEIAEIRRVREYRFEFFAEEPGELAQYRARALRSPTTPQTDHTSDQKGGC